ncbi:decarboxylase [archaeon]|nr:decarboxylase [archaeon]MBT6869556.1 decarboxylase [archaeon]MBT7193452.1 decarboxylase [archaeon]MBT7381043.1 decarboxylase [archaeon]MBT7507437.1 decarboxylase [archaeon]
MNKNSAYFEISKSKVLSQFDIVAKHCDIVSYSSKTNPLVTGILEKNKDCMFSIHLENELVNIKDKSKVLFLAQAWNENEILELLKLGVNKFAVDNMHDLTILEDLLSKKLEIRIETLFLRLKLKERTIRTEKYFVFGISSENIDLKIKKLRNNLQIVKLGLHFHRKTQNMAEWNYGFELAELFDDEFFNCIDFVNMGGGLPAAYANTNIRLLKGIFTKIDQFREWLSKNNIKLIIEPGRFIAAPAGKLITKVIAIDSGNITVNASVYNTDMDALIVPVKLLVENELSKNTEESKQYVIKGITPCSLDLFRYRVYLKEVKIGDELVFLNAGAYNFSSNFCNLNVPGVKVVE